MRMVWLFQISGLSQLVGGQLANLSHVAPWIIVLIVSILTGAMTEIATNTATMTLVMPILDALVSLFRVIIMQMPDLTCFCLYS